MSTKRKKSRVRTVLVLLVAVTLLTNGCSSMQIMDTSPATPMTSVVEIGDQLRITTTENDIVELVVESVKVDSASGGGKTVLLNQIQLLEIKRISPGRTIALVAVLTVTGLIAFASSGSIAAATW